MYSEYIKQLLKDFASLAHKDFMRKYKPEELLKAQRLSKQEKARQIIDAQVEIRAGRAKKVYL